MVKKTLSFFSRVIRTIRQAMERKSDQDDRPEWAVLDWFRFILGAVVTQSNFFGSPGLQFAKPAEFVVRGANKKGVSVPDCARTGLNDCQLDYLKR